MSQYYPQYVMKITALAEDFIRGSASASLAQKLELTITPKSLSVSINDYRTADTFSCEMDYRNFPFDPRSIRSMQVIIYIQDMKSLKSASEGIQTIKENIVFAGFADEATMEFDDDDRIVKFSGRDQTSILIDTRWDGTLLNLGGANLKTIIETVLAKLDSTRELKVDDRTGEKMPTLSQIPGGYGEPVAGEEGALKNKRSAKQNETYWDLIQDLVTRSGLIAYIEIDKLVITKPNALYKIEDSIQFVYGRNLTSFDMKRKIGRMKDINLQLLSNNPSVTPPVIKCTIPKDASAEFKRRLKLPEGDIFIEKLKPDGTKEEKPEPAPFISFNIPRVPSKARLIEIGQNIFEEMSRQQIEGSFKTSEMSARDLAKNIFDLTKIRIGTPIQIRIDNDDLIGMREVDSENDRINYLVKRGYKPLVAKALAAPFTEFGSPFYTKSIEMSCDADNGFSLDVKFINFIELKKELIEPKKGAS